MSSNQRIALVVAALVVAVIAFVVAQPGDDDDGGGGGSTTTSTQTETSTDTGTTATEAETETAEEPPPPPEPQVFRIQLVGGVPQGGVQDLEVERGDTVRIVVTADAADDIHLHGYDIERQAGPGQPARFRFVADAEGAFEIESHVAEDAGREPLIATLVVNPS